MDIDRQMAVRSVSKSGGFLLASEVMKRLSATLSDEEAIKLYIEIRDGSRRLEVEWRDEFLSFFPRVRARLPTPQDPRVDPDTVFAAIDQVGPSELRGFVELIVLANALKVPLGTFKRDGLSLREYAERAGKPFLVDVLAKLGAE